MEPQFLVLVYSKHSPRCRELFDGIQQSGVNISETPLQLLCADSPQIRKHITDSQLKVTTVPCVLVGFSDGTVEKYDGQHAFNWIGNFIQEYEYIPPTPPPRPREKKVRFAVQSDDQDQYNDQYEEQYSNNPDPHPGVVDQQRYVQGHIQDTTQSGTQNGQTQNRTQGQGQNQKQTQSQRRPKMKPFNPEQKMSTDPNSDRYRQPPPQPTVRKDPGNYENNSEFFQGQQPPQTTSIQNSIRPTPNNKENQGSKMSDIRARAEQMMKSRSEIEQIKPQGQPVQVRP